MAHLSTPTGSLPGLGSHQTRPPARFSGLAGVDIDRLLKDFRHLRATDGTISDVMVLKTAGGEVPFVNGRVWLLRYADGFKAWEGWTDAAGAYTATGLETGVDYVAVGIDPTRNHKTTGAGPVTAV